MVVVSLLALAALAWLALRLLPAKVERGNDRFGLCFVSAPDAPAGEARYEGALAAGARWDRWPLYWNWIDAGGYAGPHPGGTHDYDRLVGEELAHGLTPLVILMGTPARYSSAPGNTATPVEEPALPVGESLANSAVLPPVGLFEPIFDDGTDTPGPARQINPVNVWADFVFNTVDRYRPGGMLAREQGWPAGQGVRHWEIWNEPDYDLFWQGSVADYYRLLEVAYKSAKSADPEATVILGGLAFYDKPDWFPAFLRLAGGDPGRAYFDVLSFHHYLSIYNSERLIQQFRAAMAAAGLAGIPIWLTESGVSVWDDYPATAYDVSLDEPFRATMAEQAAYVLQNSALAFYNGVERYYHFMLHDDCGDGPTSAYGLRQNFSPHACNPGQGKARPAYAAYQLAAEQFRDIIPLWRDKSYEQDQVAFYRAGDEARLLLLWATQGVTVTATISATGESARLYWIESTGPITQVTGSRRERTLTPDNGFYTLTLPPATNQNAALPTDAAYQIGGRPYLLVEQDTLPPWAEVQPLPPASPPTFAVRWWGEDGGSGVVSYDVWVSEDGGALQRWLSRTGETEATYTGEVGHTYGFAVRARDRAGNESVRPAEAQGLTQVVAGPALAGVVLGPDGRPVAGAGVTVTGANSQASALTGDDGSWPAISLPAGRYTIQAEAAGYTAWPAPRQVALAEPSALTLTLAPAENSVAAGDFEGSQVWNSWEWPNGQISLSIDALDGQAGVRLGDGRGEPAPCPAAAQPGQLWTLQQPVSIPAAEELHLSFWYKISTTVTTAGDGWLEVAVVEGDRVHELAPPGEIWQAAGWRFVSFDLSGWQGRDAAIRFQVVRCSDRPFSVTLDRVSLGAAGRP